jgi:asparagine synthase (glutamine-hydrolysing)
MSIQFGSSSFDNRPATAEYVQKVVGLLSPYAVDGQSSYRKDGAVILYFPFHTTKESRWERQPHVSLSNKVFAWDGRLDNRTELLRELGESCRGRTSDVAIVAKAYDRWGTHCFSKLIGDWALTIWEPQSRELVMAKDFLGGRHLYYLACQNEVTWSTVLDPLVLLAGRSFPISEEYVAGWLSLFPATHLTPFVGIRSVAPATFVRISRAKETIHRYWEFDPGNRLRYRSDNEYEEHFRMVFSQAVRRRLRSDKPIVGELSGGLDSSSIVSMADAILATGAAETPRLETISYYDDCEPNWDERRYFTKVEEKRGRSGCHINIESHRKLIPNTETLRFLSTPSPTSLSKERDEQAAAFLSSAESRIILSGIGGDEVLGGVPTPIPELADYLGRAHLYDLGRRLIAWALVKRKPILQLLGETLRAFLPLRIARSSGTESYAPWLDRSFVRRNRAATQGYDSRFRFIGPDASFQSNVATFGVLRRQLACSPLPLRPLCEKRYPYLDRDLVQFLFSIPRDQIVRPHQRRSLMRRALVGIVPQEVLDRKRKGFAVRGTMAAVSSEWSSLSEFTRQMVTTSLGIVNAEKLKEALDKARVGQEIPLVFLARTLTLESWLRHLRDRNFLPLPLHPQKKGR